MTDDGSQGLDTRDMICFALYSASHAMTRFYRPLLGDLGLTYPQLLVLVELWAEDGQPVSGWTPSGFVAG